MYVCPDVRMSVFFDQSFYDFVSIWYGLLPDHLGNVLSQKKIAPPRPLCPTPLFLVFWGDFSRNFGTQVRAHLRPFGLYFCIYGMFGNIIIIIPALYADVYGILIVSPHKHIFGLECA